MDPIIFTSRLKLTLITQAERGSPELEWLHEIRSNEKTTWWSIHGRSKSIEDTEKVIMGWLPANAGAKTYKVVYAVHEIVESRSGSVQGDSEIAEQETKLTRLIGNITLMSVGAGNLPLPEDLTLPATAAATILTAELGYQFLPIGWGKGYATESVAAVFEASKQARSFWAPFSKLYIRAMVNDSNQASMRVMDKVGMKQLGVYHWTGKAVFLAGEWREHSDLYIYGAHLIE